ncbi:MAG TPA: tRNA pseudouridine(38-40) synthase TruA [Gammaproteobacteria bacterium]|nr:tRNA pseudouridine(38-40) synthase TruA [Gammaproteobacteria bacterium]
MRWALSIEYDGTAFHGWQRQPAVRTVQGAVEAALSKVANRSVFLQCAGRTDAGVHALNQVVHFDSDAARNADAWVLGGNVNCPDDIAIHWAKAVDKDFHARFSAQSRRYQYWIQEGRVRSALARNRMAWTPYMLDVEAMHQAGQSLIGELDFSAFRGAGCQSHSTMRHVSYVVVQREEQGICFTVQANAFLLHMVRNIAGCLFEVGRGKRPIEWLEQVLSSRDRRQCAATAPACGLYLTSVQYPPEFQLPDGKVTSWPRLSTEG